jgi:hypothetical protein
MVLPLTFSLPVRDAEGAAARVTGEVQLQLLATMWKSKLD